MPTRDWSSRLPWGGVLFMLVFGITTRDCILIASAALLTVYVARTRFTHGEALDMWRCAIRSWMVGGASLVLALLLVIWVVGMHTGLWEGAGIDTPEMLWLLGLCVLGVGVATVSATPRTIEAQNTSASSRCRLRYCWVPSCRGRQTQAAPARSRWALRLWWLFRAGNWLATLAPSWRVLLHVDREFSRCFAARGTGMEA